MDYPYSLPTPTVTQRLNQRNYDDHSKYPMTITRNDGRVIASQMAKSDILADVSNIHTCITRYVEKIGKLAKEDEWLQVLSRLYPPSLFHPFYFFIDFESVRRIDSL
jgi:hypothetical protein